MHQFPVNAKVTDEAKDLMSNLICDQNARFKGLEQFKAHPWFTGMGWEELRNVKPPYQPQVSGPDDTSNFDIDELRPPNNNQNNNALGGALGVGASKESLLNVHLPFVGFTCTFTAQQQLRNKKADGFSPADGETVAQQLQQQINHVIVNHENNVTVIEQRDEPVNLNNSGDSNGGVFNEQTANLIMKLESDLRLARQEWSEVSARLGELRKEKTSLSTRLRSKEEEIEQQLEKNNDLRQQLRNAERIKRQQLDEIILLQSELDKERQLRKEGKFLKSEPCLSWHNFFVLYHSFITRANFAF